MPLADGFQFARMLREHERKVGARAVPLVALTANALKADVDAYTAASFRWFVPKPFRRADLTQVLHTVLADEIAHEEQRRTSTSIPSAAPFGHVKRASSSEQGRGNSPAETLPEE
jgi:DNA-binding NarL/FixJ family response regulator